MQERDWEQLEVSLVTLLQKTMDMLDKIKSDGPTKKSCLYDAISMVEESYFFRSCFPLLTADETQLAADQLEIYQQSFDRYQQLIHDLVSSKRCILEPPAVKGSDTELFFRSEVKPLAEERESISEEQKARFSEEELAMLSEKIIVGDLLNWSDYEFFKRLNAYSILSDVGLRHPLEKFLMKILSVAEDYNADIKAAKELNNYRFRHLDTFIYYFSERSLGFMRTPLWDAISTAMLSFNYTGFILEKAKQLKQPASQVRTITVLRDQISDWFERNSMFEPLRRSAYRVMEQLDFAAGKLGDEFIDATPETMLVLRSHVTNLLLSNFPALNQAGEKDDSQEARVEKFEVYRQYCADVTLDLVDAFKGIKVAIGNEAAGAVQQCMKLQKEIANIPKRLEISTRKGVIRTRTRRSDGQQRDPALRRSAQNFEQAYPGRDAKLSSSRSGILPKLASSSGGSSPSSSPRGSPRHREIIASEAANSRRRSASAASVKPNPFALLRAKSSSGFFAASPDKSTAPEQEGQTEPVKKTN